MTAGSSAERLVLGCIFSPPLEEVESRDTNFIPFVCMKIINHIYVSDYRFIHSYFAALWVQNDLNLTFLPKVT